MRQQGFGLNSTPYSEKDAPFALGVVMDQIDIATVPKENWDYTGLTIIENQQNSDMCGGHAGGAAVEHFDDVPMCKVFQFATSKWAEGGDIMNYGTNLRAIGEGMRKIGSLPKADCPHCKLTVDTDDYFGDKWRNINSWPKESLDIAKQYKIKSYLWVDKGRYDTFDNIRSALWKWRDKKQSIITGVGWRGNWTGAPAGVIPQEKRDVVGGHAVLIQNKQEIIDGREREVVQNSYGQGIGDDGRFKFDRGVINRDFTYGAIMPIDLDPEVIRQVYNQITGNGHSKSWWQKLLRFLRFYN